MTKRKTSTKRKNTKEAQTTKYKVRARMPSGDLVAFQVSAIIKRPKGVKLTPELLQEMIRQKALTSKGTWTASGVKGAKEGRDPKGVQLKITAWKNPDRKKSKDKKSRSYGSQAERWGSLRRALALATFNIHSMGSPKGKNK